MYKRQDEKAVCGRHYFAKLMQVQLHDFFKESVLHDCCLQRRTTPANAISCPRARRTLGGGRVQVESDIKPFKGLLMGLFFMSVGMDMQFKVFLQSWTTVLGSLAALIVGKLGIMMLVGKAFGLSNIAAIRSGLYVAPGGEFAFVVFAEAVEKGLLSATEVAPIVFMVVLSMAITPYLGVRAPFPSFCLLYTSPSPRD